MGTRREQGTFLSCGKWKLKQLHVKLSPSTLYKQSIPFSLNLQPLVTYHIYGALLQLQHTATTKPPCCSLFTPWLSILRYLKPSSLFWSSLFSISRRAILRSKDRSLASTVAHTATSPVNSYLLLLLLPSNLFPFIHYNCNVSTRV